MITVGDIYNFIDQVAPFETQVEWDNSGLLVGDKNREVEKIAFCLDVTRANLERAIKENVDLIISHHPVIWDPMKFVPTDSVVSMAIRYKINIISAHTNWDAAEGGVSNVLANLLGLQNAKPFSDGELSMVYVGELPVSMTARDFSEMAAEALDTVVSVANADKEIKTVAVCGGAGSSFLHDLSGVDAFLTGEAHHHDFIDAKALGMSLMAAGHYETETVSMPVLKALVAQEFPTLTLEYYEDPPVEYIG